MVKKLLIFSVFLVVGIGLYSFTHRTLFAAAGDFVNIGTAGGTDGSSDAVTWSPGFPIMIDSYGKYIVMESRESGGNYHFEVSNDQSTWTEAPTDTGYGIRASSVYDPVNDKIHVVQANGTWVKYYRYKIIRDKHYNITDIIPDPGLTPMTMDSAGSCSSFDAGYPLVQLKSNGSNGILVAAWSVKKTCSGIDITETRASMRVLFNGSPDGTAGNWVALNGVDDSGTATGPASVHFNILYHYAGSTTIFQHSMFIRGGTGGKSSDLYYFNTDENTTNGFKRLSWNSGSSNWSGSWTSRVMFGGNVDNSHGYGAKQELISKPVYDPGHDRVYVGIARWLDNTNGDTQSLYYIDSADSAVLAGNVYSAGGTAWFAPTMDIMYDQDNSKLYYFFQTSDKNPNTGVTDTALEGKGFYKTYDGSTFSTATQFFSESGKTIDIPVVYQSAITNRILLFFRVDGVETPFTPPHSVYWGYLDSGGTTFTSQSISSPFAASSASEFNKICTTMTDSEVTNNTGGEISLASAFRDDFLTPISPYTDISSQWTTGTWSAGSFTPLPSGTVNVWGTGGAYMYGNSTFNKKTLEFRAKFTNNNSEHIGWSDTNGFNTFIMFSTFNNGQLNARIGGTTYNLGSSYYGSYHTYKITWGDSDIKFFIDGSQVASDTTNITTSLNPIISNNTTTVGADLVVDWINVINYPQVSGSYISCILDSGTSGAEWGTIGDDEVTSGNTSISLSTRTSSDGLSWSSWDGTGPGDSIHSAPGRYLQYKVDLQGTAIETPQLNSIAFEFSAPIPTSTPTPSPTPTPVQSGGENSSSSNSNSLSSTACSNVLPGGTPDLFQIDATGTTATLYFSPVSSNADRYTVVFGYSSGDDRFNTSLQHGPDSGVLSYTLNSLSPNSTYYVRVRADNGCKPGSWGNEMKFSTARSASSGLRYYKNFLSRIFSFVPKKVTSVSSLPKAVSSVNTASQQSVCQTYTVGKKDTLWSIAASKLGSGSKYPSIVASNKSIYPSLTSSTAVHVGWKLKVGC
jgi:hypothetical protein